MFRSAGRKTYGRRVGESYKDAVARLSAELVEAERTLDRSHRMLQEIGEAAEQAKADAYERGYQDGRRSAEVDWKGQW